MYLRATNTQIGIAFIAGQLGLGGSEQQLYYLLSGLDRARFRPMVISLGLQSSEYWEQRIRNLRIPLYHFPRSLGRGGRALRIASLLRAQRIQIVHGWDFHTNPYSALSGMLARVPLRFGSVRGQRELVSKDRYLSMLGYRGLDVLVINSVAAAARVRKLGITRAGIKVVCNGTTVPPQLNEAECIQLRSELGFRGQDRIIGTIGRLDANKNHAMLLRVFASLYGRWPDLQLLIVGDGPLKSDLVLMAEKLGVADRVHIPGTIPVAARYLPTMEICCLTSHSEGMPNVVMEAAAAGLPVVSTTCGGSSELIEDGSTGYLVPPNDHTSMAEKVEWLLMNPEQGRNLGRAGREKIIEEYGVQRMQTLMTSAYDDALLARRIGR